MADRIYRLENGEPVELEARDPSKRYEATPLGLREWADAEESLRSAEEAAYETLKAAEAQQPEPKTLDERIAAIEARIDVLEGR